jgi:hypothetical protein
MPVGDGAEGDEPDAGAQAPRRASMIDAFKTNGSSPPAPDFDVTFHGSLAAFTPLTPAARDWVQTNVHVEPWQWLGNATFIVDLRFVQPLITGILAAGMDVQ